MPFITAHLKLIEQELQDQQLTPAFDPRQASDKALSYRAAIVVQAAA
jgi:hypothetical protein